MKEESNEIIYTLSIGKKPQKEALKTIAEIVSLVKGKLGSVNNGLNERERESAG